MSYYEMKKEASRTLEKLLKTEQNINNLVLLFAKRYGLSEKFIQNHVNLMEKMGLVYKDGDMVRPKNDANDQP